MKKKFQKSKEKLLVEVQFFDLHDIEFTIQGFSNNIRMIWIGWIVKKAQVIFWQFIPLFMHCSV